MGLNKPINHRFSWYYIAANFLFLTETRKRGRALDQSSSDSGIELSQQEEEEEEKEKMEVEMGGQGEDGDDRQSGKTSKREEDKDSGNVDYHIPLLLESDMDSESDPEPVGSDSDLLLNERRETEGERSRLRFKNPRGHFCDIRREVTGCMSGCVTCVTACYTFDWRGQLTPRNMRAFAQRKLRDGWITLKRTAHLIKDRRILLSTSMYGILGCLVVAGQEVGAIVLMVYWYDDGVHIIRTYITSWVVLSMKVYFVGAQ